MSQERTPDAYLVERVREALAEDPELAELHLDVTVSGEEVFLLGTVATEERRREITRLVERVLPGHRIRNDTTVEELRGPEQAEDLS
jgi:osmotically-inducible protein OsmY